MRREVCNRSTMPSFFPLLLLFFGLLGFSWQQESPFQESLSKTSDVALKDLEHGSVVDRASESGNVVCGDGGSDARSICIDCAAARLVFSAADCCHERQAFDLCISIIGTDNDDDDDRVTIAGDEDEDDDNRGFTGKVSVHGAEEDDGEDDVEEDGAVEVDVREDKRKSPFLGKRRSPFLGKRRSPFLGKRRSPFLGKRRSPFLGKRRSPFLGKRRSPFLGKRRSPFLGKRRSPFLGKREEVVVASNAHP